MVERMWTYPELKFVFVNQLRLNTRELALQVNRDFHDGFEVRSPQDIEKVKRRRTIFGESKVY
jgi:hypothetical protein